jgi:hypothetical protein
VASPEPPQAPVPSSCEQYANLVAKYDWDIPTMLAIMKAESSCNPDAIGDTTLTYQGEGRVEGMSCGLYQIRVLAGRPGCDVLRDVTTNVEWAYKIYQSQGYRAWSVWTNGKYKQYL